MSAVDLTGYALLSGKVLALGDKFAPNQLLAETLLGVSPAFVARLTGDQVAQVVMAVALQLNFQVEQGLDPFILKSDSSQQQGESKTYQDNVIHPQAQAIIGNITITEPTADSLQSQFAAIPPVRSVRGARRGLRPRRRF